MKEMQTQPGLPEPVRDAQQVFRASLEAMSRPGTLVEVCVSPPSPYGREPAGRELSRGMTALALSLCDHNTPVWLDAASDSAETRHHLRFHCGCDLVDTPAAAAFALITEPWRMPRLQSFCQGMPDYPDRSATLVVNALLDETLGERFVFHGPGIKAGSVPCRIGGLPEWFREDWAENHAGYPLGVDMILVDDTPLNEALPYFRLLGLPRSVSFEPLRRPHRQDREVSACMLQ